MSSRAPATSTLRRSRSRTTRRDRLLRGAEYLAAALAGMIVLATTASSIRSGIVQRSAHAAVERAASVAARTARTARLGDAPPIVKIGDVLGVLEIPRLRVSTAIFEGDDQATLDIGIGHLRDTPLPWDAGNVALSGHRDTVFRRLRDLRLGDDIQVLTARGRLHYRVRRMLVVMPEDVSVLDSGHGVDLTLITCFPFTYVGAAPKRFVAQAERVADPGVSFVGN